MPKLHLADLPDCPPEVLESLRSDRNGAVVLIHPCPTSGIVHLNLYFSLADLAAADYSSAALLGELIGKLPTARHSVEEIQQEIKTRLGRLKCKVVSFRETGSAPDACKPYFVLQCSLLEQELPNAAPLLRELLLETDFTAAGSIREILLQTEETGREKLIADGHLIGILRSASHLSASGAVREQAEGYSFYAGCKELRRNFDDRKAAFSAWATAFQQAHFTSAALTISATGPVTQGQAEGIAAQFPQGRKFSTETARYAPGQPAAEGIAIPSDVSYAVVCADLTTFGGQFSGTWNVLANILTYEYLWNEVRVRGGAYGTGFAVSRDNVCGFYSYRDPGARRSLDVYRGAAGFLRRFCAGSPDLERYLIGAAGAADPLLSARARGDAADRDYFMNVTHADRLQTYREMLSAAPGDLEALCGATEQAAARGSVCIVGANAELTAAGLSVLEA